MVTNGYKWLQMVTNGIDVSSKYNVVKVVQKKRGRSSSVPIKLMKRYRPDDELLANETKVIQNDSKVSDMMEEDGCGEFAGNNDGIPCMERYPQGESLEQVDFGFGQPIVKPEEESDIACETSDEEVNGNYSQSMELDDNKNGKLHWSVDWKGKFYRS